MTVSYGSIVGSARCFNSRANFLSSFDGLCTNLPKIGCFYEKYGLNVFG